LGEAYKEWGMDEGKNQMNLNPKDVNCFYKDSIPKLMETSSGSPNVDELVEEIEKEATK
jgi:hypothetical protein